MATSTFLIAPPNYGPNVTITFQQIVEVSFVAQMSKGPHMPLVLPSSTTVLKATMAIVPTIIPTLGTFRIKI
jgi:hypothetical protein